jgi:hypothetical protein
LGLLTIFAMPAAANHIDSAVVTPSCTNYTITVSASQLIPGVNYTIEWSGISVTDTCGTSATLSNSISFTASSATFTATLPNSTPAFNFNNTLPISCPTLTFSGGSATLVEGTIVRNTVSITYPNGQTTMTIANCAPTTCVGTGPGGTSLGASSPLITSELGEAGPSNFAVLSLGGTGAVINLNLAAVNGNVGMPNPGTVKESNPSTITGEVIVGSSVNTSGLGGKHGSVVVNDSLLNQAVSDAETAASHFAGLSSTPSVQSQFPANGNITGNLTVTGTAGLNVVDLPSFTLNNGSNSLTLTGPAGAAFVINIAGDFNLHTGNIKVAGGVGPLDVLYNITSPNASVVTMVPTTAVGILLAPDNAISSMDSKTFTGEVIGGFQKTITLMSGTTVTNPCEQ